MIDTLHILFGDAAVGSLIYDRKKDEITLSYEDAWQFGSGSFPVLLSLPLAKKTHQDASIRPFLQGLLPDNPAVIEAWGKRFQVYHGSRPELGHRRDRRAFQKPLAPPWRGQYPASGPAL